MGSIVPAPPPPAKDPFSQGPSVRVYHWEALWGTIWPSIRFLIQTEVHVYSFAVAANILLTFFPFLVAIILLCRSVFHWQAAVQVIFHAVDSYFPSNFGVDFAGAFNYAISQHKFSWLSVFLLLFTSNGIFVPMEVALNRIWRVEQNRTMVRNQVISLGLIFACGVLVLGSVSITALNVQFLTSVLGSSHVAAVLQETIFKVTAPLMTMLMIFLIYWLLPNAKIPVRRLIPASLAVGILLEISKYVNILTWPYLRAKLRAEVPPFVQSISILLWAFIGTMIILAGAEWSARVTVEPLEPTPEREPEPEAAH